MQGFLAAFLQVDFTESFKLFCTTRLPNPHYTPELSAKVINSELPACMAQLPARLLFAQLCLNEGQAKHVRLLHCMTACSTAPHTACRSPWWTSL